MYCIYTSLCFSESGDRIIEKNQHQFTIRKKQIESQKTNIS
jgi:hypothetical protein